MAAYSNERVTATANSVLYGFILEGLILLSHHNGEHIISP